jgi:uncharacterized protein YigE (DUF2233 family)
MSRLLLMLLACVALRASAEPIQVSHLTAGSTSYDVVELDLQLADLKLYWKNADGVAYESIGALRSSLGKKFLMATNSGIYSAEYTPLGLHVERGEILSPVNKSCASKGNFFKCPNGIFMTTKQGAKVIYTKEYSQFRDGVVDATQSGPILVRAGKLHPAFQKRSQNLKLRSGVGVNAEGHVFFAISHGTVDFYDFAVFFRDTLHCPNALYLDGTISVLTVGNEDSSQLEPFVGIWAATR